MSSYTSSTQTPRELEIGVDDRPVDRGIAAAGHAVETGPRERVPRIEVEGAARQLHRRAARHIEGPAAGKPAGKRQAASLHTHQSAVGEHKRTNRHRTATP